MSALLAPDGPALKLLPAAATLALHGLLLLALAARWEWQPERTIEARTITPKIIEAKLVTLDQLRPEPKPKPKPRAKPEPRQQAAPKPKPKPAAQQAKPAPKTAPKTTPKAEPRAEPKPAPKAEPEPREEQRMSAVRSWYERYFSVTFSSSLPVSVARCRQRRSALRSLRTSRRYRFTHTMPLPAWMSLAISGPIPTSCRGTHQEPVLTLACRL